MKILGISGLYHDSAAALIVDGNIVAAAQEERFSRIKHDASLPVQAIKYCLEEGNLDENEVDYVVYYDNPMLTLDRYLHGILDSGEFRYNTTTIDFNCIFEKKIWIDRLIRYSFPNLLNDTESKLLVTKHHISHAASAFFPSPYNKSVIITIDGVGEWTTLSIGIGENNHIEILEEMRYPHSLGLFYSAFSYFCGFKVNSGEYKLMGLAPYGEPVYEDIIKDKIICIRDDGSFRLNLAYFNFQNGGTMIDEKKFSDLFHGGRREPEDVITKREMDIAASVQTITEEVIIGIAKYAKEKYGKGVKNLCMAGGVALNCVANGKLLRSGIFDNIWIQPAAGDAGGAIGAALFVYYDKFDNKRLADEKHDNQKGSYLGPSYSSEEIEKWLFRNKCIFHVSKNRQKEVAEYIANGNVVGYFSGRMEFGPRALGHRSIFADPRSETMQSRLNLKIKFRESFRPFAPMVLLEDVSEWFEIDRSSPYMLFCADVNKDKRMTFDYKKVFAEAGGDMLAIVNNKRSLIPAVTHVDYSARVQTVDGEYNSDVEGILREFKRITGYGVLVNTSFNVRGEPIVCSPEDAINCFMKTDMDVLILEDYVLLKNEQESFCYETNGYEYESD